MNNLSSQISNLNSIVSYTAPKAGIVLTTSDYAGYQFPANGYLRVRIFSNAVSNYVRADIGAMNFALFKPSRDFEASSLYVNKNLIVTIGVDATLDFNGIDVTFFPMQ
jgi:hypothetical protein